MTIDFDPSRPRGHISPMYSAHCGCGAHYTGVLEAQDTRSGCAAAALRAGWRKTRAYGWVCPPCLSNLRKGRA